MKKRGMSAVVSTLLIILLAIIAIGIVWVVVRNIISEGKEDITLTGLTLDLEIVRAFVDEETEILSVTVKRNAGDGDLIGINFVISDGDNSVVVRRDTNLPELGMETFEFILSALAVNEITSIEIAAIFETSSGRENLADPIDTATYDSGEAGSGGGSGASGSDDPDDPDDPEEPGGGDPPCTQDCTDRVCGLDPVCNEPCLPGCSGDDVCTGEGLCVPPEECLDDCESLGYECSEPENEPEICGVPTSCGECLSGVCNETFQCYIEEAIFSGEIDSVWPPTKKTYFDTDDPPIDEPTLNYNGNYIKFLNSAESECLIIRETVVPENPIEYNKTIIYLFAVSTDIAADETYEIWETFDGCYGLIP